MSATAPALIEAAREVPHDPQAVPMWSENYVFQGFDPKAGVGFYHHMGRMPYDPTIWRGVFATCLPDGAVLAMKDYGRTDNGWGPETAGLAFICEEPLSRWSVRYDGVARLTSADALSAGFLADGQTVPVVMELSFETSAPPWSFGHGLDEEAWADFHYEQPGRFSGRLAYDGRTVDLTGVGYRDHSVGPRDVAPMLSHTWVHGEFPSGRCFQAFAAHSRPDQRFSSAYVALDGQLREARIKEAPSWSGTAGDPGRFVVHLETDDGPAEIEGRTLSQRFHWTILSPWEFVLGTDLNGSGTAALWPCLETMVEHRWDGETGYGLLEVTRPRD